MYFAIIAKDAPTSTYEKRQAARPGHIDRMNAINAAGKLLTAGPLLQDHMVQESVCGSLIIADFDSQAAAQAWIDADPFVTSGVYGEVVIKPYKQTFPK